MSIANCACCAGLTLEHSAECEKSPKQMSTASKPKCETCGDSGVVGRPPDDYWNCPDCRKTREWWVYVREGAYPLAFTTDRTRPSDVGAREVIRTIEYTPAVARAVEHYEELVATSKQLALEYEKLLALVPEQYRESVGEGTAERILAKARAK